MNRHNLKVGQTVYIRAERAARTSDGSGLEPYEIEKVGRVWATLNHNYYRVHLETLVLGDGCRGSVWLSEQSYKDAIELNKAWTDFMRSLDAFRHRSPKHITLEAIKEARLKLGI